MALEQPVRLAEMSSQAEEYLEAVCRLQDRGEMATATELALELKVAPPSVLGMLRRLEEQGLVSYSRQTGALLTAHGQTRADALRRRHRLAERLLTDLLGLPWERSHDIACRFEHIIDDEVETYLDTALHHPTTCPHGNPLDGAAGAGWRPLITLASGQSGRLRCVMDESVPALDYLNRLQLRPGARVTICALAPFDGPLTVEVDGERYAISHEMAAHLMVEMEEET